MYFLIVLFKHLIGKKYEVIVTLFFFEHFEKLSFLRFVKFKMSFASILNNEMLKHY